MLRLSRQSFELKGSHLCVILLPFPLPFADSGRWVGIIIVLYTWCNVVLRPHIAFCGGVATSDKDTAFGRGRRRVRLWWCDVKVTRFGWMCGGGRKCVCVWVNRNVTAGGLVWLYRASLWKLSPFRCALFSHALSLSFLRKSTTHGGRWWLGQTGCTQVCESCWKTHSTVLVVVASALLWTIRGKEICRLRLYKNQWHSTRTLCRHRMGVGRKKEGGSQFYALLKFHLLILTLWVVGWVWEE